MRAHQIMTKGCISVTPHTTIEAAARIMLTRRISGLPVLDDSARLVGIVSESDFLRRSEIGTGRKRPAWLRFLVGPGKAASEYVHERGRRVEDVMTRDPITVDANAPLEEIVRLMEKNDIKRLPVMSKEGLLGIVTRSNLLQAVASLAHEIPDPTADDDHIRDRIIRDVSGTDWSPLGFEVTVRNGVVHLHGLITADEARQASIVAARNTAGVKAVHDHLCLVDTWSGYYVESPDDRKSTSAPERITR
jgi:CBS domain-containing protein